MATFEVKSAGLIGFESSRILTPNENDSIYLGTVGALGLSR